MSTKNGTNGRNSNGTFAKGNAGGPGNPHLSRYNRLRGTILDAINAEDGTRMERVIGALLDKAEAGDVAAAKLLLEYGVGKPRPHDDELSAKPDRFEFDWSDYFIDNPPPASPR